MESESFAFSAPLEMWAGIECTVNRVGDRFFDQIERSGHAGRISDLDLFAQLGIRTMRYPILWERTAPNGTASAAWSWADERLNRLRELAINPIVGLVHHGSGPRHTSLIDREGFPVGLSEFARQVAERYPWIERYTPVNEALTTARFSGLYGHWYPHARKGLMFARALLTQCRAVVLSMRAIRRVNSAAQLVQTDDLSKTFSTPLLSYQAAFENERRWLPWDLLCGRVDRHHPMWRHLHWLGVDDDELLWFLDNPCPPDVIGVNYYITSERFIDERIERYPASAHGGNGHHSYADVEAVRVRAEGFAGPGSLLGEVWERYGIPVAVTEAHLGCTREEQLRWLLEVWQAAQALRKGGANVCAVTAWSLLGAYDWDSLLTCAEGHYEPGVFDLRAPHPRPTALADMITDLAAHRLPAHPVLATSGWWHKPKRLLYSSVSDRSKRRNSAVRPRHPLHSLDNSNKAQPIAITGATGTLGRAVARLCDHRGLAHHLLTRDEMDIADPAAVARALDDINPWAVVNAAGYVRVDDAELQPERCSRENTEGPVVLAAACAERNAGLVTFSSDLVFSGHGRSTPYVETDQVNPLGVYGRTKAAAEHQVLAVLPSALIIRTSAFFGPWDEHNFVINALRTLAAGHPLVVSNDAVVSPTYVPDLVHATLDLLIDGERGVWHLANPSDPLTWAEFAKRAATLAGIKAGRVEGRPTQALGYAAQRPLYSVLGSERGMLLPSLDEALVCYLRDCEVQWNVACELGDASEMPSAVGDSDAERSSRASAA